MRYRYFDIVTLFTSLIILMLFGIVVLQSLLSRPIYSFDFGISIDYYRNVLGDYRFLKALMNTVIIALIMTVISVSLGLIISIAIHKARIPLAGILEPFIAIPMFISPIIWGFAWNYAYGPSGFLPMLGRFDVIMVGIIAGLVHVPHAYAIISSTILSIDSSLEEVAKIHGAGSKALLLRIIIPLIIPSIIFSTVLLIILGIEQFGIPLVLLAPWGEDVLTTYLYSIYNTYVSNPYPRMAVVASVVLYMTVSLLMVQRYIVLKESRRFVTISERGRGFYALQLSRGIQVFLLILVLLYIVLAIIVPLASIVLRSLFPLYGSIMGSISFDAYVNIFGSTYFRGIIINTLVVSLIASTLAVILYLSISITAVRSSNKLLSALADITASLPRAMPGLVAGLAFLWLYLLTPLRPIMYTYLGLALAYVTIWSALGSRIIMGSMIQISRELENVALIHGVTPTQIVVRILAPLLRRSLLITWLLVFILSIREYSIPVFIATSGTQVIGSSIVLLFGSGDLGTIAALSTISLAISSLLAIIIFRLGWRPYGG